MKQKLYDLINRRVGLLQQAEAALEADNRTEYQSLMEQITNLNGEIQQVQALVAEQERQMLAAPAPTGSEAMDMIQERTAALQRGDHVAFTANEVRRALRPPWPPAQSFSQPAPVRRSGTPWAMWCPPSWIGCGWWT